MPKKQGLIPLRDKVRELERIYGIAERAIAKELLLMDVGNYQELRAIKIEEKIDRLIRMLNRKAIKWTKESIPMAYEESHLIAKTRLEILDVERDKEFNKKKHRFSVEDYIERTMEDLIKANQSIKVNVAMYLYLMRQASLGIMQIQEFGATDEAAIEGIIMQAVERGEKPGYATNLIRNYFKTKTRDGQFILINGRNYNLRDYSKLVARTRMRQVQSEAVKNTCEQYGNDLVKVSDHNSEFDDRCLDFEGKVFSLSGGHPLYPLLDTLPPWHPNCRHNILPTSEEAIRWQKLHREVELPGVTYEDLWQKSSTYKVEYAAWYDKKGNLLLQRKGTKTSVQLTQSQYYKLRLEDLGVGVHTHPMPISFSGADLAHFSQLGLSEGHVITSKGIYKIKPGPGRGGTWPDPSDLKNSWNDTLGSLKHKYNQKFTKLLDQGMPYSDVSQAMSTEHIEEVVQTVAKKYNLAYSFTPT